jgi:hypothetical protein
MLISNRHFFIFFWKKRKLALPSYGFYARQNVDNNCEWSLKNIIVVVGGPKGRWPPFLNRPKQSKTQMKISVYSPISSQKHSFPATILCPCNYRIFQVFQIVNHKKDHFNWKGPFFRLKRHLAWSEILLLSQYGINLSFMIPSESNPSFYLFYR